MLIGLVQSDSTWEFLEIALLACLCAIHNHGFEMLFSFSKTVQRTPYPPIGFGILKAGLNKSVLMSVYTTFNFRDHRDNSSHGTAIFSMDYRYLLINSIALKLYTYAEVLPVITYA